MPVQVLSCHSKQLKVDSHYQGCYAQVDSCISEVIGTYQLGELAQSNEQHRRFRPLTSYLDIACSLSQTSRAIYPAHSTFSPSPINYLPGKNLLDRGKMSKLSWMPGILMLTGVQRGIETFLYRASQSRKPLGCRDTTPMLVRIPSFTSAVVYRTFSISSKIAYALDLRRDDRVLFGFDKLRRICNEMVQDRRNSTACCISAGNDEYEAIISNSEC